VPATIDHPSSGSGEYLKARSLAQSLCCSMLVTSLHIIAQPFASRPRRFYSTVKSGREQSTVMHVMTRLLGLSMTSVIRSGTKGCVLRHFIFHVVLRSLLARSSSITVKSSTFVGRVYILFVSQTKNHSYSYEGEKNGGRHTVDVCTTKL